MCIKDGKGGGRGNADEMISMRRGIGETADDDG